MGNDPAQLDSRIRASFNRQAFMTTLGASLVNVAPGEVTIDAEFRKELTQQHEFLHAGAVAALVDSACGYAAMTLVPPSAEVLTVEFKINMLTPAKGQRFRAVGRVLRVGRRLTVCSGEMRAWDGAEAAGESTLVVVMQATIITMHARSGS